MAILSMITLLHPRYHRSKLSKKQFTLELLWELPKDWSIPLPCHKAVAVYSLYLPYLTIGLGC